MAEAGRYAELKILQDTGKISALQCQPAYKIQVNETKIGRYTADFLYHDERTGKDIVEDVKGQIPVKRRGRWKYPRGWSEFRLRVRIVEALYGVEVVVVANTNNCLTDFYKTVAGNK